MSAVIDAQFVSIEAGKPYLTNRQMRSRDEWEYPVGLVAEKLESGEE